MYLSAIGNFYGTMRPDRSHLYVNFGILVFLVFLVKYLISFVDYTTYLVKSNNKLLHLCTRQQFDQVEPFPVIIQSNQLFVVPCLDLARLRIFYEYQQIVFYLDDKLCLQTILLQEITV